MPCPKEGWRGHCAQKWGQEEPPICDRTWCWSRFGCLRHFCPAASFGWTPIVAGWQPQQPERALIHYSFRQDRGNGSPSPPWRCQMFRIKPSVGRPKFQTFKWQLHLVGNRFPTGPLSITSIHGLSLWDCCRSKWGKLNGKNNRPYCQTPSRVQLLLQTYLFLKQDGSLHHHFGDVPCCPNTVPWHPLAYHHIPFPFEWFVPWW